MQCPVCNRPMISLELHEVEVDHCVACGGVWLDSGDPIKNVPMSLRNDGHKVLSELPLDADANHYKVLVEKVEE